MQLENINSAKPENQERKVQKFCHFSELHNLPVICITRMGHIFYLINYCYFYDGKLILSVNA
jgi:hypothetical protein